MASVKIVAISDLHGLLPEVPPCDLLLLGGDLCPVDNHQVQYQANWLNTSFRRWLEHVPARKIGGVAGNHDYVFERAAHLVPPDLPWSYLQDSGICWEGLNIWGSPWQPWFHDWAFNLYERDLVAKWALIPAGTDILVLHGPPHGYGDAVPRWRGGTENTGSPSLLERIRAVEPRVVIYGHIHEGRGEWRLGRTVLANVTLVNASYAHAYPPWEHELTLEP